MNSTILQLRQNESNALHNGDYETILSKNLKLMENDTISIRNVFIDSVSSSSGKIVLEEDYTIDMDVYYYIQDWQREDKKVNLALPQPINSSFSPSNDTFICCDFYELVGDASANLQILTDVTFYKNDHNYTSFEFTGQSVPITLSYQAFGKTHYHQITITERHPVMPYKFDLPSIYVDKENPNVQISFPSVDKLMARDGQYNIQQITNANCTFIEFQPVNNVTRHFYPYTERVSLTMSKGSYSPDDLAQTLSKKLSENKLQDSSTLTTNNFLKNTKDFSYNSTFNNTVDNMVTVLGTKFCTISVPILNNENVYYPGMKFTLSNLQIPGGQTTIGGAPISSLEAFTFTVNSTAIQGDSIEITTQIAVDFVTAETVDFTTGTLTANKQVCFINSNGSNGWFYDKNDGDKWMGTSQMAVEYNDNTNRFAFKYTNMPLYVQDGVSDAVESTIISNFKNTANKFIANKNSGVIFNNISSTPAGFFTDKLGFTLSDIIPTFSNTGNTNIDGIGGIASVPLFEQLIDGKHLTGAYTGLDNIIQKTTDFYKVPDGSGNINDTSETQFEIEGNIINDVTIANTGYFLIELTTSFIGDMITANEIKNRVFGIVNRYYNQDNYTSSDISSGIPYIHRGNPVMLSSIKVRILNPDGTLADNIGPDNTVFLEILRNK
jgi:hypothetical protein